MRDQEQTYESAGESAKELRYICVAKMSGRPGKDQSKAPDFGRICVNLTSASKNSPRLTRLTRVHA